MDNYLPPWTRFCILQNCNIKLPVFFEHFCTKYNLNKIVFVSKMGNLSMKLWILKLYLPNKFIRVFIYLPNKFNRSNSIGRTEININDMRAKYSEWRKQLNIAPLLCMLLTFSLLYTVTNAYLLVKKASTYSCYTEETNIFVENQERRAPSQFSFCAVYIRL